MRATGKVQTVPTGLRETGPRAARRLILDKVVNDRSDRSGSLDKNDICSSYTIHDNIRLRRTIMKSFVIHMEMN